MSSFYVIRGKDSGQHFLVRGAVSRIGRGSTSQIRLNDTEVSRQHAIVIRAANGNHDIVDNGSSNGSYVNGRKVQRQTLQSGDRVQVGRTLMIFTSGPEPKSEDSAQLPEKQMQAENVEIVAESNIADMSQIRQSMESQAAVSASQILGTNVTDNDSSSTGSASDSVAPAAAEDWEIVCQVGHAVSRTLDVDDLLDQVLQLIFQWIKCDRGCVMLFDERTGNISPACSRQMKESSSGRETPMRISQTILDHVLSSKEGVLTSNAQDDTRWENAESVTSLGVHEAICVPMVGRYGTVGAIYVDTTISAGLYAEREGASSFDEEHLKLMFAIGGQAALAIEDTQFYRAVLQSEKLAAMGQTIANLSHHVKNILQGVSGGGFLVKDGLAKSDLDVIGRGWKMVERNQERISNLVMDMLSFSKEREPELEQRDIRTLLDDVIELMSARASDMTVELLWRRPTDGLLAEYDNEALHRALLNDVTNAIDAAATSECDTAKRVEFDVQVDQADNQARISIIDNGDGLNDEDRERIFSPFESSKGARGTGLGLPVSRKILREHGGDILVSSKSGEGTRFTLAWPASQSGTSENTIAN